MNDKKTIDWLVGKQINKIYMNEDNLKFDTNDGEITFEVDGDCCSHSAFYDFYGVKDVLGKVVKSVKEIELNIDERMDGKKYQESISVYGFEIVWEDMTWGDRTAVFSFRNYSNGYYGGSMQVCDNLDVTPEVTQDVVMTQ